MHFIKIDSKNFFILNSDLLNVGAFCEYFSTIKSASISRLWFSSSCQLFPKWKQLLDKKKSSRIKYGYHHVMDLKSKCKLYGAKLLIAVL